MGVLDLKYGHLGLELIPPSGRPFRPRMCIFKASHGALGRSILRSFFRLDFGLNFGLAVGPFWNPFGPLLGSQIGPS